MNYRIFPPEGTVDAAVLLPPSKSMAARLAVMEALEGRGLPDALIQDGPEDHEPPCQDLRVLAHAITAPDGSTADLRDSGTAMRLMTALAAATPGRRLVLDGSQRLRQRPLRPLIEALRSLGADIECLQEDGCLPVRIQGRRLSGGATVDIDASTTSQMATALALIAPKLSGGLTLRLLPDQDGHQIPSLSYLRLTLEMMRRAGVDATMEGGDTVTVPEGSYVPAPGQVEGDWSAASVWYQIQALATGWVDMASVRQDSPQPDARLAQWYQKLGVLTAFGPIDPEEPEEEDNEEEDDGFDAPYWGGHDSEMDPAREDAAHLMPCPEQAPRLHLDMADNPDLAPAVAVTACVLGIPFRLEGLSNLRHKESDRLDALARALAAVSYDVEADALRGTLAYEGRRHPLEAVPSIDPCGDHRIAMALAPMSLLLPGLEIRDAQVVEKSYPGFWRQLRQAGFRVEPSDQSPSAE